MTQATAQTVDTTEISFEEGIIGVPRARRFQLLEQNETRTLVLRCLDIPGFSLPVVDPRLADPDFMPRISPRVVEWLQIDSEEKLLVLAVTTPEGGGSVANLRAPLLINVERRIGAQVILDNRSLPLRAKVAANS